MKKKKNKNTNLNNINKRRRRRSRKKKENMKEFCYKDIEAATENFSLSRLIGKGSHGCVYKGILLPDRTGTYTHTTTLTIAVKKPSLALQNLQDNTKLDNEIDILSSLPHKSHPYIVNLLGVSHESLTNKKLLIMEFMPNGSLHDSLHNSFDEPPSWYKRALIVLRLARAVQLLHESKPSVIHRDIKAANILFDSNWEPRLADFGLAVRMNDPESVSQLTSQPAGTMGYLDPSYTTPGKLSTKNDVFSFGVVVLEIISCRRAIDVYMEPSSIVDWALPLIQDPQSSPINEICDSRTSVPYNMVSTIRCMLNIAARCVSSNEGYRPSMHEIVTELEKCVKLGNNVRIFPILRSFLSVPWRRRKSRTRIITSTAYQQGNVQTRDQKMIKNKVPSVREVLANDDDDDDYETFK